MNMNVQLLLRLSFVSAFFVFLPKAPADVLQNKQINQQIIKHSSVSSRAIEILTASQENFDYPEYVVTNMQLESGNVNLLNFQVIPKKFPHPKEKYNRQKHFGGWIKGVMPGDCLNTRGQALKRDSATPVTINSNCTVTAGTWLDPYTNQDYTDSGDIQIDHVVPLKNAYMTGASEWDSEKRCLYANYLGNKYHLRSVNGTENMLKGDRSPLEYVPPNKQFDCQYISDWLKIKFIWKLKMTPLESQAIQKLVNDNVCSASMFKMSKAEYNAQLDFIQKNAHLCAGAALMSF